MCVILRASCVRPGCPRSTRVDWVWSIAVGDCPIRCARHAQTIHLKIMQMNEGYITLIWVDSTNLGGQRTDRFELETMRPASNMRSIGNRSRNLYVAYVARNRHSNGWGF
jgi:hypothetical protein